MSRLYFIFVFDFLSTAFALQPTAPELRIPVGAEVTHWYVYHSKVSYKMNELIFEVVIVTYQTCLMDYIRRVYEVCLLST